MASEAHGILQAKHEETKLQIKELREKSSARENHLEQQASNGTVGVYYHLIVFSL